MVSYDIEKPVEEESGVETWRITIAGRPFEFRLPTGSPRTKAVERIRALARKYSLENPRAGQGTL